MRLIIFIALICLTICSGVSTISYEVRLAEIVQFEKEKEKKNARELICLVENAFYEAYGEGLVGRLLVTAVVFNRAGANENYCEIIHKKAQFSWTASKSLKPIPKKIWSKLETEMKEALAGKSVLPKHLRVATHYHTTAVKPIWRSKLTKLGTWKNHIFYIEPQRRVA